jgi:hypothetical protein
VKIVKNACISEITDSRIKVELYKNEVYIFDFDNLWSSLKLEFFLDIENYANAFFSEGGIWLIKKRKEKADYNSEFQDCFGESIYFSKQKHPLSDKSIVEGEKYFVGVNMTMPRGVFLSNHDGDVLKYREGKFYSGIVRSNQCTFLRDRNDRILCLDYNLDEVWTKSFEKDCFSQEIFQTPQLYKEKNLVIVNVGEKTDADRGEFELNAYNADNGDLVWQVILEETPCSSNLIGDKVYIIVLKQLVIVDANNGEILVNVKHGFRPFDVATSTYQGMVCPMVDSSNLICISPMDRKVQIRSSDANQVLQTINIPLPYMPSLTVPVEFEGSYYLPLQHIDSFDNGMKGGLLVFETDVEEQVVTEIEASIAQRPPTSVELIQNESGYDAYQVSIEHDALKPNAASKTLDDLIRFSTIALKETAFKYGSYTSSTETNKNHHGQLLLSVKPGDLKKTAGLNNEELLDKLQIIKERVERNLADTSVQAGDGSSAFVVDIQIVE